MLRSSVTLPLRLLKDVAPAQRQLPSSLPIIANASSKWTIPQQQTRTFSTTEPLEKRRGVVVKQVQKLKKKKRYPSPEAKRVAEMRQRKNTARQAVLQDQRALDWGDKVWGRAEPTEFVRSFDEGVDSQVSPAAADETVSTKGLPSDKSPLLNAFYTVNEVRENLDISRQMTEPVADSRTGTNDPATETQARERHEADHGTASEAINRILAVDQTTRKQRKHINIQRCIDKLGRHTTDPILFAPATTTTTTTGLGSVTEASEGQLEEKKNQRIGEDTGSPEVQIAILTMKIRRLAQEREGPMRRDKVNKRNMRLLLHRRQKMLRYFYKKNGGGPRWQHLVDTLGVTDAMWKGEIQLE